MRFLGERCISKLEDGEVPQVCGVFGTTTSSPVTWMAISTMDGPDG